MGAGTTYSGVIGWLSWFCSALTAQASERVEGRLPLALYEPWSEKRVEPGLMTFRGRQARTPKLLPSFEPSTTGPPVATVHPAADANFT